MLLSLNRLFVVSIYLFFLLFQTNYLVAQKINISAKKQVDFNSSGRSEFRNISPYTALFLLDLSRAKDAFRDRLIVDNSLISKYGIINRSQISHVNMFIAFKSGYRFSSIKQFGVISSQEDKEIITGLVPVDKISDLSNHESIKYISIGEPVEKRLDSARIKTRAYLVHAGYQLPNSFTGSGVVVGVIDKGFDYTHASFYNQTGTSGYRVKRVWEQNDNNGMPPQGFSYGRELATQSAIIQAQTDDISETHGTHVAGIAAGSGGGNMSFRGMAPESEIVLVSTNFQDVGIKDGIDYIMNYAQSVNKPCVINMSLGKHIGPHDGTSLFDQHIDLRTGPGKIIVGAAGNEGDQLLHIKKIFTSADTSLFSFIKFNNSIESSGQTFIDAWGSPLNNFKVAVNIYNTASGSFVSYTNYISASSSRILDTVIFDSDIFLPDPIYIRIVPGVDPLNNKPHALISIDSRLQDDNDNKILFELKGLNTTVNCWLSGDEEFTSYNISGAVNGNSNMTVGEIGGTANSIITVGSFNSKLDWINIWGSQYQNNTLNVLNDISLFSSKGPTADGRTKPDITAPGNRIASSINSFISPSNYDTADIVGYVQHGQNTSPFGLAQGTSMASPAVAGIIALWLQANGSFSPSQIKQVLRDSSIRDTYTGIIPSGGSNTWGWGKINAYKGIKAIAFKPSISPKSDTAVCFGQSIVLTAPSGFSQYEWSNNATTQSITVTSSGAYSVRVRTPYGFMSYWSDTINVNIDSAPITPTISRQNISNNCIGQQLLLSSSAATAYQWYRNDTIIQNAISQTYQPTVNASYRVRVFSQNRACSTLSDTVMVNLAGLNVTGVIQQDTIRACGVDSVTLTAGAGYSSYLWSNGATTQSIRVGASGKYSVQVMCGPNVYNSNYFTTNSNQSPRAYASIPNASQYAFTNNMTIIFRLRVEVVPNGANVVLQKGEGSSFQFSVPSWPFLKFTYPGIGKPNGLNGQISQWNWAWVAVVKTPDSVFLYINNVIADRAASPSPIPVTSSPIIIGKAQEWDYLLGSVDQLSFWNRSLTSAEILNYQSCMVGSEPGCVGYYNFDQTITATIPDFSSYGNTAINNGRVIGYGSPFITCTGTILSDSIFVSLIKSGITQGDTTVCRNTNLTLTASSNPAANNICSVGQLSNGMQNGIVAYYPFCSNTNDVSGNYYHGVNNGAVFVTDRYGNPNSALDFNGTNSNILLGSSFNAANITNELTIGMWVNLRPLASGNSGVLFYAGNGEWSLSYDNTSIGFSVKLSDGLWWTANIPVTQYLNKWTYIVGQFKKGQYLKIYADGSLGLQLTIPDLNLYKPNISSYIGSLYGNVKYANAKIDDIIIYNRILSPSEINSFLPTQVSYLWSTGSTASSISVSPTQSTTYYLTTSDGVSTCTDSVRITIASVDTTVTALDPISICIGVGQARLQAASSLQYQWLRNGQPIQEATSRVLTVTQAGQYRVALVNALGCRDTSRVISVLENPQPAATFTTNSANQCLSGNNYQFTNNSSISSGTLSYLWNFGDGNTSTASNASHSYNAAGTYTVKLVVTSAFGCKDSISRQVTVYPKPIVTFSVNQSSQCVNINSFVFTNTSTISTGNLTFQWSFGDGNGATTTNASYTYSQPGTYLVKLIAVSNNGCADSITQSVTVNPKPTVNFNVNNVNQCLSGNQFVFTNQATIASGTLSHRWDFGDGSTSTQISPSYSYSTAGTFQVKLVSTSLEGCRDSISRSVAVFPMPSGTLNNPSTNLLCEGSNVVLTATGGSTYQWLLNGGAIAGANSSSYSATQPGTYTVNVSSANGCSSLAAGSVTLQLVQRPIANFSYDKYCAGFATQFNNQSNISNSNVVTYNWNFGQGQGTSILANPSYTFSSPSVYNVTLIVSPVPCPALVSSVTKPVTIVAPPPNQRYTSLNAIENRDLQLEGRSFGGASYNWSPASGLNNATISNPIFNFNAEVDYTITITTGIGCVIKDTQLVRVFKAKEIYVPKGFSPNGDGSNDKIFPRLVGVRLLTYFKVFNRWGQLLYQTSNENEGWDGYFKGTKQPMEAYVWIAEGIDVDNNIIKRTGTFLLLR
jgi:minor extracellular serine protease Vpr